MTKLNSQNLENTSVQWTVFKDMELNELCAFRSDATLLFSKRLERQGEVFAPDMHQALLKWDLKSAEQAESAPTASPTVKHWFVETHTEDGAPSDGPAYLHLKLDESLVDFLKEQANALGQFIKQPSFTKTGPFRSEAICQTFRVTSDNFSWPQDGDPEAYLEVMALADGDVGFIFKCYGEDCQSTFMPIAEMAARFYLQVPDEVVLHAREDKLEALKDILSQVARYRSPDDVNLQRAMLVAHTAFEAPTEAQAAAPAMV